jgi:cyclic beta-1,2-glucan synthetase
MATASMAATTDANSASVASPPAGNRLEELAAALARSLEPALLPARPRRRAVPGSRRFRERLRLLEAHVRAVNLHLEEAQKEQAAATAASEWVLDNHYVVERAVRQVGESLPPRFYRRLPRVRHSNSSLPRVEVLAAAIVRVQEGPLSADQLMDFVQAFQTVTPLEIGEIWALPALLRLASLEILAAALARITSLRLPAGPVPDSISLGSAGEITLPATDDASLVSRCILSLRSLATQDWRSFFEAVSVVERILREDPAGVYPNMDPQTRNRYRLVIEELADGSNTAEVSIAREVVRLARARAVSRELHVGYFLIDGGTPELKALIGFREPIPGRLRHILYEHAAALFLGSIAFLTVILAAIGALYALAQGSSGWVVALAALLGSLPASAIAVDIVNRLVTRAVPPRVLPSMDFRSGVPAECSTMVVLPALLTNENEFRFLLGQLETHYLSNQDPNIRFALLTDFSDGPERWMSGEGELLASAETEIEHLNAQYATDGYSPFYYFHRERAWNPAEGCWMGRERKRGKLTEFNDLVLGSGRPSFISRIGDMSFLSSVRYVITLDADTSLPRDSARRLIACLAHPLNRGVWDPVNGAVTAGYTILQPRVQVRPTVANQSLFTRVYSGDTTLDLYTRAVSNVYQDLFGEGSFIGKGIYDVRAFQKSLEGRVPDNTLLSHDLLEGLLGRCGLATGIVFFEDYPPHYLAYARRQHRWIRGDWQLLPWLCPGVLHPDPGKRKDTLSAIDRWKIIDNLRRSLVSPAILALLLCGWLLLPGSMLVWTALALSPLALEILLHLSAQLRPREAREDPETSAQPAQLGAWRALFALVFLPHEAIISIDAISTTLWRVFVSHRRLLEWTTAAHSLHILGRQLKLRTVWIEMASAPLLAALLAVILGFLRPAVVILAGPLILLWLFSPLVAVRISRPIQLPHQQLSDKQTRELRLLARQTWLFFEQFVGPEDHWLPPDHFQEDPRGLVAHRTSPTNIGLLLLSTLAAYDFGYIGPEELVLRLHSTFDGMDQLERERGHLLNWYDTRTLAPLPPRYISTVDSGNLSAALLALRAGCAEAPQRPLVRWSGLTDTLDALDVALQESHLDGSSAELHSAIASLREQSENLRDAAQATPQMLAALYTQERVALEDLLVKLVEGSSEELDSERLRRLSAWIDQLRKNLSRTERDVEMLTPWALSLASQPEEFAKAEARPELAAAWDALIAALPVRITLAEVPDVCGAGVAALKELNSALEAARLQQQAPRTVEEDDRALGEALAWCDTLGRSLESARASAEELLLEFERLRSRAEAWFDDLNFAFLFDPQREVFHIGYNLDAARLDPNYYDMLASEARLASLIAIARGDVPQSHWLSLARPITQVGGRRVLLSWSGTMFEYLMPTLLTRSYAGSLLDQTCSSVVDRQRAYAQSKGTPWGISESGYYQFDSNQAYQYRAFGIPELGYKRGLGEDLVVAPYASLLALSIQPLAVVQNIASFREMGMVGQFGFFEAADFTASRLAVGQRFAVIRSYMAHHQGMIMLALCNYLRENVMVQRFHADPRIATVQLLLQEKTPHGAPIEHPHPHEIGRLNPMHAGASLEPWAAQRGASYPQVHYLSNGRYGVLVSTSGGGFSRWGQIDLTRWRADPTMDGYGTWLYVRDEETGQLWSVTSQPSGTNPESSAVRFYPHAIEFLRQDEDVKLRLQVVVHPHADAEIRRVSISNHGERTRRLSLTSYGEVILAPQATDQRHPAFNKLFIESEYVPRQHWESSAAVGRSTGAEGAGGVLLFRRRPRSAQEKPIFLAHFAVNARDDLRIAGYETDRAEFLGRGGTARAPAAMRMDSAGLTGTTGATLDPIFSLRAEITLRPFETVQLAFVTVAAGSRKEALALADRLRRWQELTRALAEARGQAEAELINLELDSPQLEQIQKLLSALIYPSPALRADVATLAANTLSQPGLWPLAISGDNPILLLNLQDDGGLPLLGELLRAHTYWRRHRLQIDLVVLSKFEGGYQQELRGKVLQLLATTGSDRWLGKRGGIFIARQDQLKPDERVLLATAARVVLDGDAGSLRTQLEKLEAGTMNLPPFVALRQPDTDGAFQLGAVERPSDLIFDNGLGGFSADGREYVIYLKPGEWTPAPWGNLIATEKFGFMLSESGLGSTWAGNSGENRLTPWRNDPLTDPPSEAIYLRDEDTGEVWSPTPLPARADAPYLVRHGAGYSSFEHNSHGFEQALQVFAVTDGPLKIARLRLTNRSGRARRLVVTYYAEWVLGTAHEDTAQYIIPEFVSADNALLVHNPYNQDFGAERAFLAASRELHALTSDRTEFLGQIGSYALPAALQRVGLSASANPGGDPCSAMQVLLWLAPGESKEVSFLLGQGADRETALSLVARFQQPENIEAAWRGVGAFWDDLLERVQVRTPDHGLDLFLNRWLQYQALSCRIWGRSSNYQPGGAYGFRDQLQDVLAFLPTQPAIARRHILLAARHEFEQGDVLHWWHPPQGRGVRTRISDDLIWLPLAVAEYVDSTGDQSILHEQIPFVSGEPLQKGEDERYALFSVAPEKPASLLEHCRRALTRGLTSGPHGLPLIGTGDWNDGMNRVGAQGIGESVWLGWFLYYTLTRFAAMCDTLPGRNHAGEYYKQAEVLRAALSASAWDGPEGAWFRRAYYDDGKPLGSKENNDCQIDSISQSWAVISGAADPNRARKAMESLYERLVLTEPGLILLLAPPFDRTFRDPGYIKGYIPGTRENGGQYTHAAVWALWAFAQLGEGDRVGELLRMINPIYHADAPDKAARYRVEPYVIAADVYTGSPRLQGRGGWTWYTGSASWMHRLGIEMVLGMRRRGQGLDLSPCIPSSWPGFEVDYRFGNSMYHIRVENPDGVSTGIRTVTLDGNQMTANEIRLVDDGSQHEVRVQMGELDKSVV